MQVITEKKIIDTVCKYFDVDYQFIERKRDSITGKYLKKTRKKKAVFIRQIIVYFMLIKFKQYSLEEVGVRSTFNYNHGSVLYCKKTINSYLSYDKKLQYDLDIIDNLLGEHLTTEQILKNLKIEVLKCENKYVIIQLLRQLKIEII